MKQWLLGLRQYIFDHKIIGGLVIAVVIALVMTVVSMWIYNTSDVARLDISRPGYEKARESVIKGDETISFGATGNLDGDAMKDFQKLFDEKRDKLDVIGKFDGDVLTDDQLKTTAPE